MVTITTNTIFAKIKTMEAKQSSAKAWLYFFLWSIALVVLLVVYREFFWLALPGVITHFVRGLNII